MCALLDTFRFDDDSELSVQKSHTQKHKHTPHLCHMLVFVINNHKICGRSGLLHQILCRRNRSDTDDFFVLGIFGQHFWMLTLA